ncbi:membrane protein [Bacillus sp. SA1-12]|uniref:AbrB family transcriptional regulator n=1 Tax=Bacillus sp. SA1-12 TaxID=1455638 RepID=UPI000626CC9F|nr:AbrB family transcriptional regulator [Bacillus sp. SA1-12]KKI92248.1 membrane protein [Bacillus sp. SA1-12]
MKKTMGFLPYVWFVTLSGIGGFLLSLTGLPIGWMIGTLLTAAFLSIMRPKALRVPANQKGIQKQWLYIGQCMLGIELGQKVNHSVLTIFYENWSIITVMLLLSIFFSLLSGLILWKWSKLDMLTSFFATAPGGLSSIPGIAEEVGANTGIVSIIQAMRVFLVIITVPVIMSFLYPHSEVHSFTDTAAASLTKFEPNQLAFTSLFVVAAWIGYYIGKLLRFPAPWLIGSMIGVASVNSLSTFFTKDDLVAWWPPSLIILSQIFIGASIGSRFHKKMFYGINRTLFISSVSTIGLIVSMFLCAYFVSRLTDVPFLTAGLAFAPGGIAEMTTTAFVLKGDFTFVVTVQVLRIVAVCLILPPFFRFLKYMELKKKTHSYQSA